MKALFIQPDELGVLLFIGLALFLAYRLHVYVIRGYKHRTPKGL